MEDINEDHRVRRVASVDVGTNSVRLLVADVGADGGFRRVFTDRRITRLGEGIQYSGCLSEKAIRRTLETLRSFIQEAHAYGAERILAGATSAVRDAGNGQGFLRRTLDETGLELWVLAEEEEAYWMMQGMCRLWSHPPDRWTAVDIGGGSTEFVWARGRTVEAVRSVPLGMVKLTEEVFRRDPPRPQDIDRCRALVRKAFAEGLMATPASWGAQQLLVGTAGTITTLAALELSLYPYDGARVNGCRLGLATVERWCERLSGMHSEQRARMREIESGREDVILAGAYMLSELLSLLQRDEIQVSDYGLLEGIAIRAADQAQGRRCIEARFPGSCNGR